MTKKFKNLLRASVINIDMNRGRLLDDPVSWLDLEEIRFRGFDLNRLHSSLKVLL